MRLRNDLIFVIIGVGLMLAAFTLNPWILEYFFSPDRHLDFIWKYVLILCLDSLLFIFGCLVVLPRPRLFLSSYRYKFLTLCVALLCAFLIAEVLVRILDTQTDLTISDNTLGTIPNPGLRPESLGFQETELNFANLAQDNLVYAIGDSFAYGYVDYDDNYLTIVDENFPEYNVVNLGVWGHQPWQYFEMIKRYSEIRKPKYILLNFFVGNDFYDVENVDFYLRQRPYLSPLFTLSEFSKLISEANQFLVATILNEDFFLHVNRLYFEVSRKQSLSPWQQSTDASLQSIDDIITYTSTRDIKLVVLILPSEPQVDITLRETMLKRFSLESQDFDIARPQRILTEHLASEGIPFIDLLPSFQEAGKTERLYLPRNTHWNPAGNALAADVITQQLRDTNFFTNNVSE